MNRVDAAVIHDLRNAALTFQARTLETMLRYNPHSPEAEGPVSETNRNNPIPSNSHDTSPKGLTP